MLSSVNSSMEDTIKPRIYSCFKCHNVVGKHDDLLSKRFVLRHGSGFLFEYANNINEGPKQDVYLMTGLYKIADVYCKKCDEILGWKYFKAYDESQKYKEGKVILERFKLVEENW